MEREGGRLLQNREGGTQAKKASLMKFSLERGFVTDTMCPKAKGYKFQVIEINQGEKK